MTCAAKPARLAPGEVRAGRAPRSTAALGLLPQAEVDILVILSAYDPAGAAPAPVLLASGRPASDNIIVEAPRRSASGLARARTG